jgi:putative ABC transport system substrate-binding protein
MRRREFISLLGGAAAAWPLAARAQQSLPRVVYVPSGFEDDPEQVARRAAFRTALERLGWVDGRNIRIDYRWGRIDPDHMRAVAAELASLMPSVIVESGSDMAEALKRETSKTPIVFVTVSDPVASGLVANMAQPGANITGFANYPWSIGPKWVQILKEVAPGIKRVLVILEVGNIGANGLLRTIEESAQALDVRPVAAHVTFPQEIEKAITDFAKEPDGGLLALPGPPARDHGDLIIGLAARYRLPAMYTYRFSAKRGGLMSYDTDNIAQFQGAASYVDRILRGERAGDLPVQLPTKYDLVVNLKTAKALGISVPQSLLAIADEVIE